MGTCNFDTIFIQVFNLCFKIGINIFDNLESICSFQQRSIFGIFQQIFLNIRLKWKFCNQTETVRLVPNQSKNGNTIWFRFDLIRIRKYFSVCRRASNCIAQAVYRMFYEEKWGYLSGIWMIAVYQHGRRILISIFTRFIAHNRTKMSRIHRN